MRNNYFHTLDISANKSVLYNNYQNSQVIFINDLISESGSFLVMIIYGTA